MLIQGYLEYFIPREKFSGIILYVLEENKKKNVSSSSVAIPNESNWKHLWLIHFTLGLPDIKMYTESTQ